MVAVFTGIETDVNADEKHTMAKAAELRQAYRSKVRAVFPVDRVEVFVKPSPSEPSANYQKLFAMRIKQVADFYGQISKTLYMFKRFETPRLVKIKTKDEHGKLVEGLAEHKNPRIIYRIRCGCADVLELEEDKWTGLKTMHTLFKKGRNGSITAEESRTLEPYINRKMKEKVEGRSDSIGELVELVVSHYPELCNLSLPQLEAKLKGLSKRLSELRSIEANRCLNKQQAEELDKLENLHAEVEFADSPTTSDGAASQGDLKGVRIRKPRSKTDDRFRGMKKSLCKKLRAYGYVSFADYIHHKVTGREMAWTHVQPPEIEWNV